MVMRKLIFAILTMFLSMSTSQAQPWNWNELCKIDASDRNEREQYGSATAISGNYAVVGAQYARVNGLYDVGAAYIYYYNEGTWEEIQKIIPSDGTARLRFGRSIAMSGDYFFVGSNSATYVFYNNNGFWEEKQIIGLSGYAIAISDNYAMIGSRVFYNNNGIWEEQQQLVASDGSGGFGGAVAISGNYAIVSAPYQHDYSGNIYLDYEAGAAYIFYNNNGTWEEIQRITASNGYSYGMFGYTLSVSGDYAIIGANLRYDPGLVNTIEINKGSIYIFHNNEGIWEEVKRSSIFFLESSGFGRSVSISDRYALVGAPSYFELPEYGYNFNKTGAVFIFERNGNYWDRQMHVATDAGSGDRFGQSVAISDGYAFVGAPIDSHDADGMNTLDRAGSAYIFKAPIIKKHPYSRSDVCVNDTISFTVSGYHITGYKWQISTDGGVNFTDIPKGRVYAGTQTDNLRFIAKSSMDGHQFRCILTSYDEIVMSNTATLIIELEKPVISSLHDDLLIFSSTYWNCEAVLPDYTANVIATDNCDNDLEIKQTPGPGTLISGASNIITIKVTDDAGNSESVSFNVAVENYMGIVIDCIVNPRIVISARDNYYTVSRDEFDPVLDYDYCGGVLIKNDFNNQSTLAGAQLPIGDTWINWIATDMEGNSFMCSSLITVFQQSKVALSKSGIHICPNPSRGILQVEFGQTEVQELTISDLNGKIIFEKTKPLQKEEIDLSAFKNGVYFIAVQTDEGFLSTKFVKE